MCKLIKVTNTKALQMMLEYFKNALEEQQHYDPYKDNEYLIDTCKEILEQL